MCCFIYEDLNIHFKLIIHTKYCLPGPEANEAKSSEADFLDAQKYWHTVNLNLNFLNVEISSLIIYRWKNLSMKTRRNIFFFCKIFY